jgi:HTH-type transcriptional regulator / antitoxin HipB
MAIGRTVRESRRVLRLTQKELADLSGCGPDFVYDVERGKHTVRLDKLMQVVDALGLELKLTSRPPRFPPAKEEWLSPSRARR